MRAYLVEWCVDWADGNGQSRNHVAFQEKPRAVVFAHQKLFERFALDTPKDRKDTLAIFDHIRDNGEHYCGGVTLKEIEVLL